MKNIEMSVEKGILTGRSKSGKTTIIASTEGNAAVPSGGDDSIRVGLNVYKL